MNPGYNEPHPIEETVFAQLLAGPLGNGVIPPGDYGPLDTSVYQSLAVANLFVRFAQENTAHLCKLLRVSRNPDWPWSNPALLPDEEAIIAISTQVRRPEVEVGASALWDFHTAVGQDPGDPEALGAAALLLLGAACCSAFEPSYAVVALHALNVVCLRLAQCPQGGPPPVDYVVPGDATNTPNMPEGAGGSDGAGLQAGSRGAGGGDPTGIPAIPPAPYASSMQPPPPLATTTDATATQQSLEERSETWEVESPGQGDRFGAPLTAGTDRPPYDPLNLGSTAANPNGPPGEDHAAAATFIGERSLGLLDSGHIVGHTAADGDGNTEAQGTRPVVSVGATQDGALGPPLFGNSGEDGSGNALADLKFRVCALVARAIMKQLKLAAMGKLRPDVQELGTQLCSCLSAFMQRECYRYQHHADIIFSEVRAHVVLKVLQADAANRNLGSGAAKLVAVLLGLEAPQDGSVANDAGLKYSRTFMQLGVSSSILMLVAELKAQPAPMTEEVRMHNYAHGEVVLSALSLLFQNSMAHGVLQPQERLKDVLTILEQVAAEVVATAEREKSRTDTKQSGDTSKLVNPQRQAAEAMRQTAELAKQLRRSIPEPRFLAQALYVVHMIALHCPSVMEAASASWPPEGFAALFKFLTPGVDPAVRQAAAGAISVILSQHIQHPSIKDVIVAGSVKLKGLINAFDAVRGDHSKNMPEVRQSIASMIRTLAYDPAGLALPDFLRPNTVISWLVEGMSDRTTHWSTRAEFASALGSLARIPPLTSSLLRSKRQLAAKDMMADPKAAIRKIGGLPAMITLLSEIVQSTRKPFQTDNVAINAMVSVVQSGITCVKENEDIGTILKDELLPLLLQIMDAENMLEGDVLAQITLCNASLLAWCLVNKAFQDEVVKLKGHESLTKLLIWYSENEPKPDPADQPPPKTPYEMRVTTHLKTACTIANVLGHAILSEPKVAHYVDDANAVPVLVRYFQRAADLTVGSDTWYIGLSNSAPCLGDCKDILIGKYTGLAEQILNTCMRTLGDIVEFAKGPKPDKTKCDRLCFATSSMAMLAFNLQSVDPKLIGQSSATFQALLEMKRTLHLQTHTINYLSTFLNKHRNSVKETEDANKAMDALMKEEAEREARAAAKARAKHDKAEKVRKKKAAEEEEKKRIQEEEERARKEAEEQRRKRAAEERLRAQEEEKRLANARQERLEEANRQRRVQEKARMVEEAEQRKRRDEEAAKRALEAAEAAAQELAASKARAEAAEKAAEAEALRKAQEEEARSKVEAARVAAAVMAGPTAGAAALSSGGPRLLSKTSVEGLEVEEPASWEERYTEGDQALSNACRDGHSLDEGTKTPEGINVNSQHHSRPPPASTDPLAGAAPGRVRVPDDPWGKAAHQAPAPPRPPPAPPAVTPAPPATYAAAALLQPSGAVRRGQPAEPLSRVSSGRTDLSGFSTGELAKDNGDTEGGGDVEQSRPPVVSQSRGPPPGFVHHNGQESPSLPGAPGALQQLAADTMLTSQHSSPDVVHPGNAGRGPTPSGKSVDGDQSKGPGARLVHPDPEITYQPRAPSRTLDNDQPLSTADQRIEFPRNQAANGQPVAAARRDRGFQRAVGGEQVPSRIPSPSPPSDARPASPTGTRLDALPGLSLQRLAPSPAPFLEGSLKTWDSTQTLMPSAPTPEPRRPDTGLGLNYREERHAVSEGQGWLPQNQGLSLDPASLVGPWANTGGQDTNAGLAAPQPQGISAQHVLDPGWNTWSGAPDRMGVPSWGGAQPDGVSALGPTPPPVHRQQQMGPPFRGPEQGVLHGAGFGDVESREGGGPRPLSHPGEQGRSMRSPRLGPQPQPRLGGNGTNVRPSPGAPGEQWISQPSQPPPAPPPPSHGPRRQVTEQLLRGPLPPPISGGVSIPRGGPALPSQGLPEGLLPGGRTENFGLGRNLAGNSNRDAWMQAMTGNMSNLSADQLAAMANRMQQQQQQQQQPQQQRQALGIQQGDYGAGPAMLAGGQGRMPRTNPASYDDLAGYGARAGSQQQSLQPQSQEHLMRILLSQQQNTAQQQAQHQALLTGSLLNPQGAEASFMAAMGGRTAGGQPRVSYSVNPRGNVPQGHTAMWPAGTPGPAGAAGLSPALLQQAQQNFHALQGQQGHGGGAFMPGNLATLDPSLENIAQLLARINQHRPQ